MDIKRIPPVGDPFTAASHHDDQDERPHACNDGAVYIGHLVEDPGTGEEAEVVEPVPWRRCADSR